MRNWGELFGSRSRDRCRLSCGIHGWPTQQMPDFGNDEFEHMVCVESGNVAANLIKLPPGETSKL